MIIALPGGYSLYGGAQFSMVIDKNATIFFSACCSNKNEGFFGNAVFRAENGTCERVRLPESYASGRGHLYPYGGQLYYIAEDGNGRLCVQVVPGYVAPEQVLQTLPPIALPSVAMDETARRVSDEAVARSRSAETKASNAEKNSEKLLNRIKAAEAAVTAIKPTMDVTSPALLDRIWSLAGDRLFADVTSETAVRKAIQDVAAEVAWQKSADRMYAELENEKSGIRSLLSKVVTVLMKTSDPKNTIPKV